MVVLPWSSNILVCRTARKRQIAMTESEDMKNFLTTYKNLPVLWDNRSEEYKDRSKRISAYQKLLVVYQNVKKGATLDDLRRKIANVRTSYRRELKKVIETEHLDESKRYTSVLWYFETLDFLRNIDGPKRYGHQLPEICKIKDIHEVAKVLNRPSYSLNDIRKKTNKRPTLDGLLNLFEKEKKLKLSPATSDHSDAESEHHLDDRDEDHGAGTVDFDIHEEKEKPADTAMSSVPTVAKVGPEHSAKTTEKKRSKDVEDAFDDATVFANAWGCMFRDMSADQQLYAKQAVDEILLLGRLNKLSLNYLGQPQSDNTTYLPEPDIAFPTPAAFDEFSD